jgi:dCMP deaminase
MTDTRPSWDDTWLSIALSIAHRSRCDRAKVGAVIVTKDHRIASTGYNGPPAGLPVTGTCSGWCPRAMGQTDLSADYSACESLHAEDNALLRADFTEIREGTIYVSRAICIICARRIGNSGLKNVIHRVTDQDTHRDPDKVEKYMIDLGLFVARAR